MGVGKGRLPRRGEFEGVEPAFGQDPRCDSGLFVSRMAAEHTSRGSYFEAHPSDRQFVALPSSGALSILLERGSAPSNSPAGEPFL